MERLFRIFFSGFSVLFWSYLIGSIPNGYLIGKFNGLDIRRHGSRNIGATNVRRILGRPWGIACFILDFLKGLIPVMLIGHIIVSKGDWAIGTEFGGLIAAVGAVLGHVFPIWLMFRGGKGVATSLGVVCGLAPLAFLVGVGIWLLSYYVLYEGVVSVASMLAVLMMAISSFLFNMMGISCGSWLTTILLFFLAAIVIIRHRENIQRLLDGTENSFVQINKK
ncbi:MAG: glycerol-3-phosphate 1-O-acyltransferase PlsY [Lentisphaeria bacterium]|nr:glycerol-3-phosphate 1-O-acyltransferase PlsY [Victivallales bacterium]MBR6060315.1 glycerol-3-phosphate 1-O-acyltransferase PlsY [Victivallales bacterium]MCR4575175.1 glycerol-3-phosphate 1-O-acyltransferase PlsY [Lentisphaeria bacterium]